MQLPTREIFPLGLYARFGRPPLPEPIGARPLPEPFLGTSEGDDAVSTFGGRRGSVVEGNFQQDNLDDDHDERLNEQGDVESCAGVVEYPKRKGVSDLSRGGILDGYGRPCTDLHSEATSMMRGISNEKPALDLLRCIE